MKRPQAKVVLNPSDIVNMAGFGLAPMKAEGARVLADPGSPPRRRRKGEKRPVSDDYMELPVPKNASRAYVHKMVDEWLDDRADGFRSAIFGTKRRKKKS